MQLHFAYRFHICNASSPSDLALTDTSMSKCANATLYALALFALHAHGWPCCATSLSRSVIKLSRSWPYNTLRPNMLPPTAVVTATVTFAGALSPTTGKVVVPTGQPATTPTVTSTAVRGEMRCGRVVMAPFLLGRPRAPIRAIPGLRRCPCRPRPGW